MDNKKTNTFIYKLIFVIYSIFMSKLVLFRPNFYTTIQNWSFNLVENKLQTANFKPFHTIKLYMRNIYPSISLANLAGNIVLFIPLGILFPSISKNKSLLSTLFKSFLFIMAIEISQLITTMGEFDVDDIILNLLGSIIGYLTYLIFFKKEVSK